MLFSSSSVRYLATKVERTDHSETVVAAEATITGFTVVRGFPVIQHSLVLVQCRFAVENPITPVTLIDILMGGTVADVLLKGSNVGEMAVAVLTVHHDALKGLLNVSRQL